MKNPHSIKQDQLLEVSFDRPGISKDLGLHMGYTVCPGDEFKPRDNERWLVRVITVWGRCPEADKGCMVYPVRRVAPVLAPTRSRIAVARAGGDNPR